MINRTAFSKIEEELSTPEKQTPKLVEGQFVQVDIGGDPSYYSGYIENVFDNLIEIRTGNGKYRVMTKDIEDRLAKGTFIIPTINGLPVMAKKTWRGKRLFQPQK